MHATVLPLLAMLAAAPSPAPDEAALARAIGDRVPGKPVNCIDVSPGAMSSTEIVPATAIVYRLYGRLYVNRPVAGGALLRRDDILVTHITIGQLCRLDPVTLRAATSPVPRGVISLGQFVPYDRPKRDRR